MKTWIGTSGFQYPAWKGIFYPDKIPVGKMLAFYATQFPTTEINYSFRRIPSAQTIAAWAMATPPKFKFSFKAPQRITHFAKLRDCDAILDELGNAIAAMKEKRGMVLFQLPPTFAKDASLLSNFLETLPDGMRAAFEFRHPSWFDDEVFSVLKAKDVALCIAENEELATPAVATADFGYLRLRREDYTPSGIARWAKFVRGQQRQWREVFIYFKHEDTAIGTTFARRMMEELNG
ncbi:MAG: DUF72 domain-containing protein [Prosthecobacter sp.]|nr:DUF72 domain-containing protein [Prosthecobacter sp.]